VRRRLLRPLAALLLLGLAAPAPSATAAPLSADPPPEAFRGVDAAVQRGILQGVYPGAVVVVGRHDRVLYRAAYGRTTWSRSAPKPTVSRSLWDIASLTKVVGTTSAAARLVDRDSLLLDAPVGRYLPGFGTGDKSRVTVRMLLDHTSGLPPYLPFHRMAKSRARAVDLLLAEPLRRAPGDTAVYSDLNALVMGLVLERATRLPLESVVTRQVLRPLGLRDTRFRPTPAHAPRIVPSGMSRGRPLRGVNDLNAVTFGGVAGHAGLFATGTDLARFAQTWLRLGSVPGGSGTRTAATAARRWVDSVTMRSFLAPGSPRSGTRLLGWDTRDTLRTEEDGPSVYGSRLTPAAYGHTGWTGVQIWIDPGYDLFLVFLTNRSFAPRARNSLEALRDVRAAVADAVVDAAAVRSGEGGG
jgi:CubicO group peptidase (beta-lactamase class C family)